MEEQIKSDFNISKMCRSCLMQTEEEELNEIFGQQDAPETINLNQILVQLTANIQIDMNDGMPDKLCKECTEKAYLAYNFKLTLERSDATLRSVLFKDQMPALKKDTVFDEGHTYLGLGIKTEIAFVDADPFIDDDGDFDYVQSTTPAEGASGAEGQEPVQAENNSYTQQLQQQQQQQQQLLQHQQELDDDEDDEMLDSEENESVQDSDEEEDEDEEEEMEGESVSSDKSPKEKAKKKPASPKTVESVDYIKDEDGKFICQICNKKLVDKKGLNLHLRLHTGENLKRCNICNRGFIKSDHLKRHLLVHEKSVNCEYCDESFITRSDYKSHVKEEHLEEDTSMESERLPKIQRARLNHTSAICKICDKKFQRISSLRTHLNQHLMSSAFDDADIKNKIFLFNPLEIDLEKASNQELHLYVKDKLNESECEKFYQIVTRDGHELLLSDSESEDEGEICHPDDRIELTIEQTVETVTDAQNIYSCTRCVKTFKRSRESLSHMMTDHIHELEDFIDKCSVCGQSFPNNYTLQKHLKSQCENKAKKLACNTCGKKFMWLDSMAKHIENEHPGTERIKLYTCELCGKAFSRSEHLERHRKTHNPSEKKFECTVCQKKFNRKDNLRSHMKIHKDNRDDEDKHLCIYCGRAFSNSSNLIVHMRRHTGEKPYKCDLCEKGFPRSSDLQCHRRTHTGERPCLCTVCGKGFSRSNKLVRHMRIHTGIRPYQCTYCDRAFTQSNDLTLHIRRHTGERPYVCGICGDKFIQGTALKQHQRMQGHFDDGTQPSPYATLSVNNPSRFTNSNLVSRRYITQAQQAAQQQQDQNSQVPIKPVIPRRRAAAAAAAAAAGNNNNNLSSNNNNNNVTSNLQQQQTQMHVQVQSQMLQPSTSTTTAIIMSQPSIAQDAVTAEIIRTPSPHQSSASHTPSTTPLTQDIKPNLQNLSLPQFNGTMPLVTTNLPNMEIATLFTMSFNQNFQNHN